MIRKGCEYRKTLAYRNWWVPEKAIAWKSPLFLVGQPTGIASALVPSALDADVGKPVAEGNVRLTSRSHLQ